MTQSYRTVTKTREMNTEYDNSLPHQDRTHYSSQNHRPTRYADDVWQRSLFKNTNWTPWQRGHQTLPLRYTVTEQFRVEGRSLPQPLLKAGLMRPGCSRLHPGKSSSPPWTESSTALGNLFWYLTTLVGTRCHLFLVYSKYFWCHGMATFDKHYYVRASTENEMGNSD